MREVLVLVLVGACSQAAVDDKPSKQVHKLAFERSCAGDMYAGFSTPEEAFTTYATALNDADYCRAANTYAHDQRAELASTTFTALLLTAGTTDKPNRADYRAHFFQLCTKYGLGCASEPRLEELVAALRAGKKIEALEPKLTGVVKDAPEDVFRDVMKTLADIDPGVIGQLSTTLKDVKREGQRATALAERAGRPGTRVMLSEGARGWMLALR